MPTRRDFLTALAPLAPLSALPGATPARDLQLLGAVLDDLSRFEGSAAALAGDEDYWSAVARAFSVDRSITNFNNGGVSPAPTFALEALKRHIDYANLCPAHNLWRIQEPNREHVRQSLAREWRCDPEELAITRNASEGMQILQFGFDLARGDEVLCTSQDYPRMVNTFKQRGQREGIVLKQFDIPTPCDDLGEIVELYRQNITPATKLILVSHVVFMTGQILPVTEITALGRARGIPVVVDGAHAFANVPFDFASLDVDYYATSLHKWLFAPVGAGLLYVRRDKIGDLWPLMAPPPSQRDSIRKFEQIGTHPEANFLAIAEVLTFHQGIGPQRKSERLLWLRDRWAKRLTAADERVVLNTSLKPGRATGLCNFRIDGIEPGKLKSYLWQEYRIQTTSTGRGDWRGIRVSPSVYSTPAEVDRFCEIVEGVLADGLK